MRHNKINNMNVQERMRLKQRMEKHHITGVTVMHFLKTAMRQKLHVGDRKVKQYKAERKE